MDTEGRGPRGPQVVSEPSPPMGHLSGGNESLEFFNHTHDCPKVTAPQTGAPVYERPALVAKRLGHFCHAGKPTAAARTSSFPLASADSIGQSRLSPPAGLHNLQRLNSFKTLESLRIATALWLNRGKC